MTNYRTKIFIRQREVNNTRLSIALPTRPSHKCSLTLTHFCLSLTCHTCVCLLHFCLFTTDYVLILLSLGNFLLKTLAILKKAYVFIGAVYGANSVVCIILIILNTYHVFFSGRQPGSWLAENLTPISSSLRRTEQPSSPSSVVPHRSPSVVSSLDASLQNVCQ